MASFKIGRDDVDAFLTGLTVFGTGGGGSPEWGRALLENDFRRGRACEIVDVDDVPDDSYICCTGIMGSVKVLDFMSVDEVVNGWENFFPMEKAVRMMEDLKGRKMTHLIPFEMGGLNTPVVMTLCARMGIPMLNADGLGRSAPETQMTSFASHGINLYPMPLVDHQGNTVVVVDAKTLPYADEIGRFVVTKGGGLGGNAHYPMSGAEAKRVVVPQTVSRTLEAGKRILKAKSAGGDPVEAFRGFVNGQIMIAGEVISVTGEEKIGFYVTNVRIRGTGVHEGHFADLVVKNETMLLIIDGKVKIMFPDSAYMLYTESGAGIPSVELEPGVRMTIVGAPAHERLQKNLFTNEGKQSFGPYRYGRPDLAYVTFQELNK